MSTRLWYASIVSGNDTIIVVEAAAASNGTGDVTIVSDTGAIAISSGAWEYVTAGVADAASPSTGQLGTRVVITGSLLRGGGAEVVEVTLLNVAAEITSENDTHVEVVAATGPNSAY